MNAQSALQKAQSVISANWSIEETVSGGWVLEIKDSLGGMVNYLTNPCSLNMGEAGKPYQVNCGGVHNFETLDNALNQVRLARS